MFFADQWCTTFKKIRIGSSFLFIRGEECKICYSEENDIEVG